MPEVKVGGKVKHFPYTKSGRAAAKKASTKEGATLTEHLMKGKKGKKGGY